MSYFINPIFFGETEPDRMTTQPYYTQQPQTQAFADPDTLPVQLIVLTSSYDGSEQRMQVRCPALDAARQELRRTVNQLAATDRVVTELRKSLAAATERIAKLEAKVFPAGGGQW